MMLRMVVEQIFQNWDLILMQRKGDVLIFHNCEKDTTNIHPKSLHAGMPVTNGEKWIVNLWF